MFIDDVQRWLLKPAARPDSVVLPEGVDLDGRWAIVRKTLEDMEDDPRYSRTWAETHHRWTREGALEAWLAAFLPGFTASVGKRCPPADQIALIDLALAGEIRLDVLDGAGWSRTALLETQRIAEAATRATEVMPVGSELGEWCRQNGLVTETFEPTALGQVLIKLHGRDAVEFVLAVGVEIAVGPADPWRMGASGLKALLLNAQALDTDIPDEARSQFAREALAGLESLGVVAHHSSEDDRYYDRFALNDDAREMVTRVATDPDSRFRALVRALLDAQRGRVSADATGRTAAESGDLSYARSVAHEIRNLTLPLSTAINALWSELARIHPTTTGVRSSGPASTARWIASTNSPRRP